MTDHDPKSHRESRPAAAARARYSPPRLEILGSLRSATRGSGTKGADGGMGRMNKPSDRAVKEEIVRVGWHTTGLAVYRFRYKGAYAARFGRQRRVGFMADEVLERYPAAVSRDANGRLTVDYSRIVH